MTQHANLQSYLDLEKKTSSGFYADNLTGVRALAVLWVLAFHTWNLVGGDVKITLPWINHEIGLTRLVKYGEWGVDIFFVLSGFLLTIPWIKNGVKTPTWSETMLFYKRRILRILPAFYFTLLVLIYVLQYGLGKVPTPAQILQHALFINVWLGNAPLRGAFWSLPVEAYFYIFLPLFLAGAVYIRSFSRFMLLMVIAAIAFRVFISYGPLADKTKFFYSFFGRLDQFAIGSLFAYAFIKRPPSAGRGSALIIFSVLAAIAFTGKIGTPGFMTDHAVLVFLLYPSIVGLICGLLIYGAASQSKLAKCLFGNIAMTFIGTISYSMYLWHTVVLDIFMETKIIQSYPVSERIGVIAVYTWPPIFIISIFSYFLVERHFLKIRHNPNAAAQTFIQKYPMRFMGLAIIALMALTGFARIAQKMGG